MTTLTLNSWSQYYSLTKPKVVYLIVFTAMVGMLLAAEGLPAPDIFVFGLLGIGLAAASGAAINHVVDEHIDRIMDRTRNRPLASGDLDQKSALIFALSIGVLGIAILMAFVNLLTAILTFFSLVGYALIYTMYLKRATPQNIVLGGAAGAAPPLLGWTAVTGSVGTEALLLFLIIFVWTPPHFWALAIRRREEYAKADIPMLPVTHGVDFTKIQILLYSDFVVHDTAVHRDHDAIHNTDEWFDLSIRCSRPGHWISVLRGAALSRGAAEYYRHEDLRLLYLLPDPAVRVSAG